MRARRGYALQLLANADETGFTFDMVKHRTYATRGTKTLSIAGTGCTNRSTFFPIIYGDGSNGPGFLYFSEKGGKFGPRIGRDLRRFVRSNNLNNIQVRASKRGYVGNIEMLEWIKTVPKPGFSSGFFCVLLIF